MRGERDIQNPKHLEQTLGSWPLFLPHQLKNSFPLPLQDSTLLMYVYVVGLRSIPYLVERNISIENFSYNTGKVISDEIQAQLNDSTFDFIGVSVCTSCMYMSCCRI